MVNLSRRSLLLVSVLLLFPFRLASALSIEEFARKPVPCNSTGFTVEWFLTHTKRKDVIVDHALFYTRGMTEAAKARCGTAYTSIWNIWPNWLYQENHKDLRCIHTEKDGLIQRSYYANMSIAFARMARKTAYVLSKDADFKKPPTNGIWGKYELVTLANWTDVTDLYWFSPNEEFRHTLVDRTKQQGVIDIRNPWRTKELLAKKSKAVQGGAGNRFDAVESSEDAASPKDVAPCEMNTRCHGLNRFIDSRELPDGTFEPPADVCS